MLACVSLLTINRKARTKPICLWSHNNSSRHFQCLALLIKLHQLLRWYILEIVSDLEGCLIFSLTFY